MDSMAAADANGVFMLQRPALQSGKQCFDISNQDIGGPR
jgi:hypothetical protein